MVQIATAAVALLLVVSAILLKPTGPNPSVPQIWKTYLIVLSSISVTVAAVAILLSRR